MSADNGEDDQEYYRVRAGAVARLFRRRPHNMTEELERLGFEWHSDEHEEAEEVAEEKAASPVSENERRLVSFLESREEPGREILDLWRLETQKPDASSALWRHYFRSGNAQLRWLILSGLDADPCSQDLLMQLAFLHEFVSIPREILARYTRACDEETAPEDFVLLAQDFDVAAGSFGYDALEALRERYAGDPAKSAAVAELLKQRAVQEQEIIPF
jgi:hypothetical protein